MGGKPKDLTGLRSGRLEALYLVGKDEKGRYLWKCKCECGKCVDVIAKHLTMQGTKSCGCLLEEQNTRMRSGEYNPKRTHGKSNTRIYRIWKDMKRRTVNPNRQNYDRYGGRGISVCAEWCDDFETFYQWSMQNGYQDTLEIDRIDNDKSYSPENCRWVSKIVNANNRACSRKITYLGETKTIAEWSKILGISYTKLIYRINAGWSLDRAFSKT